MRIVIEVDGERVTSAKVEATESAPGPPPEVLRRAAERGALNAGPAPSAAPRNAVAGRERADAGPAPKRPRRSRSASPEPRR